MVIKDALDAIQEFLNLTQARGDQSGSFSGLLSLARVHRINKDGKAAASAAEEALQIAATSDEGSMVGAAMLALAEAQLLLGDQTHAQEYAGEAATLFEQVGDHAQM